MGSRDKRDYPLDFSHSQSLEALRSKLDKSLLILKSNNQVAEAVRQHAQRVADRANKAQGELHSMGQDLEDELQQHMHANLHHQHRVERLLNSCKAISIMVRRHILPFSKSKSHNSCFSFLKYSSTETTTSSTTTATSCESSPRQHSPRVNQ